MRLGARDPNTNDSGQTQYLLRAYLMYICAAGDIHGALNKLYDEVLDFEASLGIRFDFVLHVGDFGIWPDPTKIDKGTRNHDGAGDFSAWLEGKRVAPRRTVFIKGNHEDFQWLDAQPAAEVLPNLTYLPNGETIDLTVDGAGSIRIGGIGGCYGPSDYERQSVQLRGYARRHFTHDEVERLGQQARQGSIDIVLTHDAPAGVRYTRHRGGEFVSETAGLADLIARVQPRVCFFGHHHTQVKSEVAGVRCIGLNKVAHPGNLCAIEMMQHERAWTLLGEWPGVRASEKVVFQWPLPVPGGRAPFR
jgi:Icc-related predicted phosphoesterase